MPYFGKTSKEKRNTCIPELIQVLDESIKTFDFSIVYGYRYEEEQMRAYNKGYSKAKWLESPHNYYPSFAFDIVPYYKDTPHIRYPNIDVITDKKNIIKYSKELAMFYIMSTIVIMTGKQLNINIRGGFNWNQDWNIMDNSFDDLGHFELCNWKQLKEKKWNYKK